MEKVQRGGPTRVVATGRRRLGVSNQTTRRAGGAEGVETPHELRTVICFATAEPATEAKVRTSRDVEGIWAEVEGKRVGDGRGWEVGRGSRATFWTELLNPDDWPRRSGRRGRPVRSPEGDCISLSLSSLPLCRATRVREHPGFLPNLRVILLSVDRGGEGPAACTPVARRRSC